MQVFDCGVVYEGWMDLTVTCMYVVRKVVHRLYAIYVTLR